MVKELEPALSGDDGRNSSRSNSLERPGAKDQKLQQLENYRAESKNLHEASKKTGEDDSYSDGEYDFNQPKAEQIHEQRTEQHVREDEGQGGARAYAKSQDAGKASQEMEQKLPRSTMDVGVDMLQADPGDYGSNPLQE